MLRLAALALVLGGLAAAFCLVPLRGRTTLARFEAAPDAGTFLSSAWDEWRGTPAPGKRARPPAAKRDRPEKSARRSEPAEPATETPPPRSAPPPRSRTAAPSPTPAPAAREPAEDHRDSDRAALDRLLSERSR